MIATVIKKRKRIQDAALASLPLIRRSERFLVGVTLAVVLTFCFYATDLYMAEKNLGGKSFWRPQVTLDDRIPFQAEWVWIYLLYFPFCFLPVCLRELWNDIAVFRSAALGFALQFAGATAIFWLLPSQMERPALAQGSLSMAALSRFYAIDPGFNVFPSLHVANATYVACLASRFTGPIRACAAWTICLLIAASTLFIKQHYLLDLPAGVALGTISYWLVFPKRSAARPL